MISIKFHLEKCLSAETSSFDSDRKKQIFFIALDQMFILRNIYAHP